MHWIIYQDALLSEQVTNYASEQNGSVLTVYFLNYLPKNEFICLILISNEADKSKMRSINYDRIFYLTIYPVPLPFPTFWISPASSISFNVRSMVLILMSGQRAEMSVLVILPILFWKIDLMRSAFERVLPCRCSTLS